MIFSPLRFNFCLGCSININKEPLMTLWATKWPFFFYRQPFPPIGQIWEVMVKLWMLDLNRRTEVCSIWQNTTCHLNILFQLLRTGMTDLGVKVDSAGLMLILKLVFCRLTVEYQCRICKLELQNFYLFFLIHISTISEAALLCLGCLSVSIRLSASLFWFGKTQVSWGVCLCKWEGPAVNLMCLYQKPHCAADCGESQTQNWVTVTSRRFLSQISDTEAALSGRAPW